MKKHNAAWPALLLTPVIALINLSLAYALIQPSCLYESTWWLHATTAVSLAIAGFLTYRAWAGKCQLNKGQKTQVNLNTMDDPEGSTEARQLFVFSSAVLVGIFFCLVIASFGIAQLVLSPCMY